jgi:hypothetical protein
MIQLFLLDLEKFLKVPFALIECSEHSLMDFERRLFWTLD